MNKLLNKNEIIYFYFQYAKPSVKYVDVLREKKKYRRFIFNFHISKFCLLLPEETEPPKYLRQRWELFYFYFKEPRSGPFI